MDHVPINAIVISISDTRTDSNDVSGSMAVDLLRGMGADVLEKHIVSDEFADIRDSLVSIADRPEVNLIVTTGGTGFSPRDNAPEATISATEKLAPGLSEAMRRETAGKTPLSMLSRGVCGIRGNVLIINLPGSPKAVRECLEVVQPVLQHSVDLLSGNTKLH